MLVQDNKTLWESIWSKFGVLPFRRVQLRHHLQLKSCKVWFVHTYKVSFVHNYFLIEELIWYGDTVSFAPSPTASRRHESGEIPLLAHQDLSHRYQTMNKFQSVDQLGFSGNGLIGGIWKKKAPGQVVCLLSNNTHRHNMTQVPEFVVWKLWKHRILKQFYHIQSENHTCNTLVEIAKPLWPIRCKPLPRPMRIRCNWTARDMLVTLYQNIQAFILGNTQGYVIWKSLPILFSLNMFISCWLLICIHVCPLNQILETIETIKGL